MILDGRTLAGEVLARAKARASNLEKTPRIVALVANETPATQSYLKIKEKRATEAGCTLDFLRFPQETSTATLVAAVLSAEADALIVQLPLPVGVDTKEVCDAIPVEKDADVLSAAVREKFEHGESGVLLPPVVAAVREIFEQNKVVVKGKQVAVIGTGFLVGAPCAVWCEQQEAHVTRVTLESRNLREALATADIIISGAGSPHLIEPEMLKPGVVLIDAGTSESGGEVVGDADPACARVCSLFTPVPGGIGPLAVAKLFENAVMLTERASLVKNTEY